MANKNITAMTSSEIFTELNDTQKDDIYRMVWYDHVCEDVEGCVNEGEYKLNEAGIAQVANDYVYNGDYDCNLSYWDNINSLIQRAYEYEGYRETEPELD